MNPDFNHLRHRGWHNSQFHHATGPHFQVSHQTTYHNFTSPPPMPLPPPIPFAASLPIAYYDTNGSYYHAPQHNAVHSPWNVNMNNYAPAPQQLQSGYYDTQFSVPPTQNNGYHLQDKSDTSRCSVSAVDSRVFQLTLSSHNPAHGANPLDLWQAPLPHHQDVNNQERPPAERHSEEPRGRKRHSRSQSRRLQSKDRAHGDAQHPPEPSTPKRSFPRAASRSRQSQPPSEGILQSAKRISRDFFTSPRNPGRDGKHESAKYRYEDKGWMGSPRGRKIQEHRQVSRLTTPSTRKARRPSTSRKHKSKPSMHDKRPSQATCPQTPRRSCQAEARNYSVQPVSPTQTSAAEDTSGTRPRSSSDLSDLDGNKEISKMNGLLDIWDSTGNPNWEEETFALCDLEHCRRCGKYYVSMRTLRHHCRR